MYKTVRHGENSLQYTILPQTEEVLSNSGLKGKGRDYSPSIHVRRSRRRSTLRYVSLILFGIIVALALASVPLYIMNVALSARRNLLDHHDIGTTAPLAPAGREIVKSRKKELKFLPEFITTANPKLDTTTQPSVTSTSVPTTVIRDRATTPPWTMPALRSWKGLTATTMRPAPTDNIEEIPLVGTPSGSVRLLDNYMSVKPWEKDIIIRPTVTPEPMTVRSIFKYYSQSFATSDKSVTSNTKVFDDVLITTRASSTPSPLSTMSTSTSMPIIEDEQSLEIDDVFSLPTFKGESAVPVGDSDEVTVRQATGGWYGARWPFVDPSSYFQWTGYTLADNLLLPLLMSALSSIVLILLLTLAVRRRKRTSTASAQIGKLTADLQADDNTNLLQAENAEDAED